MKISALRLFDVKRFAGRGVAIEGIGDGVNVLCAPNEFGKSTSFEALHALFFQAHTSTGTDVRSLRPYAGGNPLVEADISTDAGRFRITKQFYGRRSAQVVDIDGSRLVAQADEAENFIANLVRGGTAGPAGLLWVRQGITGIEKRTRSEEDGERQVRESLLQSVQGEIEAVTGGRRMAEIMATATDALGKLVTATGRPRTGGTFATVLEERTRLEAEERRLAADVATLREALDQRAVAERHLAERDASEARATRAKDLETARDRFDAARTQMETLRAAEAELKLAQEQRSAAERELTAFRTALQRSASLDAKIGLAVAALDAARARSEDAASANIAARTEAEAAELHERETRALRARLDMALHAREAAERLSTMEQQLEAAEAARKGIEEAEAQLKLLVLPDRAIEDLDALDLKIMRLQAVADAGRPSIAIAYEANAPLATLDGDVVPPDEPRNYDGEAHLHMPGVGTITLRASGMDRPEQGLREAEERRRAQLQSIGVADLPAARKRQADWQRKNGDLRELKALLSALAPHGLQQLREEVAARREAATDTSLELKYDPTQVRAAHEAAEARLVAARQGLREAEPLHAHATNILIETSTANATLLAERGELDALLGPEGERAATETGLSETLRAASGRTEQGLASVNALRANTTDLVSAEAALKRAQSVAEAADKEIGRLREQIAGLNAQIRSQSDLAVEERWRETAEALASSSQRAAAYEKEVATLQRLLQALETAKRDAREAYLLPVMTELRPLIALLFDDVSLTFDEKTLLPQTILRNGQEEEVERLSGGMREQLSVLTRLAFARLLAKTGRPAPVILDDALVYSDDDRIEKMFDALHRQSRDQQIIVFSCRQRAFQRLGGNVLHTVDWTPR